MKLIPSKQRPGDLIPTEVDLSASMQSPSVATPSYLKLTTHTSSTRIPSSFGVLFNLYILSTSRTRGKLQRRWTG